MPRHYGQYDERPREGRHERRPTWRDSEYGRGEVPGQDRYVSQSSDRFEQSGNFGRSGYRSYGDGDYQNGDYSRNESRTRTPYSENSHRRQFSEQSDDEILDTNWDRTRGSGEWSSHSISEPRRNRGFGSENQYEETYYGQGENQGSGLGYGQSAGSYDSSGYGGAYGRAYDDYYRRQSGGSNVGLYSGQSSGQSYQGGGYHGQSYGAQPSGSRFYSGQSYSGQSSSGQWHSGQSHAGKGPKGYQRSDDRIKEIVCEALLEAPHIDASDINVEVQNREVKLTGTVSDRRTKFAAEELVESRAGSCDIRNELRVASDPSLNQRSGQGGKPEQTSRIEPGKSGDKSRN